MQCKSLRATQQQCQTILTGDTACVSEQDGLVPLAMNSISIRLAHRAGSVWTEQPGQLIRRDGQTEKVPLGFITIVCPQKLQIFSCFNPLSNDPEVKASTHVYECSDGGRSIGNGGDLADERPVDLEGIERQFLYAAQAGVTRAEIID